MRRLLSLLLHQLSLQDLAFRHNPATPHDAADDEDAEDNEEAEGAAMAMRIDEGSDLMSQSASSNGGSSAARRTREEEEEEEEEQEEEEEMHAVDKILAVKKINTAGALKFLVAWEGWQNDEQRTPWEDSWEPERNLTDDLVADF